jgi:hypothetical protein
MRRTPAEQLWEIGAGVELNGVEIVGIGNDGKWKWKAPPRTGRWEKTESVLGVEEDTWEDVNLGGGIEQMEVQEPEQNTRRSWWKRKWK